jgi:hypothetical protein
MAPPSAAPDAPAPFVSSARAASHTVTVSAVLHDTVRAAGRTGDGAGMQITVQTDEARERVILRVPVGVRWATFVSTAGALLEGRPETADWSWLIDDAGPIEDVDAAGMMHLAGLFRRLSRYPDRRRWTVIVTCDPHFADWARVMDLHHGARRHLSAPTAAAAEALLDRLEGRG